MGAMAWEEAVKKTLCQLATNSINFNIKFYRNFFYFPLKLINT